MTNRIHTPQAQSQASTQRFPCIPLSILAFSLMMVCAPSMAVNITYDGSNPGMLATTPGFVYPNSLFPGASLSGNTVTIENGTANYVYGGLRLETDWLSESMSINRVFVSGGQVTNHVYGGYNSSNGANVGMGNSVTITGGTVGRSVYGAYVGGGNSIATGNSVTITGGMVMGSVYGTYTPLTFNKITQSGNTVMITGGSVGGISMAHIAVTLTISIMTIR